MQPEATNLLGDVLGGVGTGLGDLAVSYRSGKSVGNFQE